MSTPRRRSRVLIVGVAMVGLASSGMAASASGQSIAVAHHDQRRVDTTTLPVPAGTDPSETHMVVDPRNPRKWFVVAQTVAPQSFPLTQQLLWRSSDGGRSWARSGLLGGVANTPSGVSGDPVVAADRAGRVLYAGLTFDFHRSAGTAVEHVGTRVSPDEGRRFTGFGSAMRSALPLCFFNPPCSGPPPQNAQLLDKPWLAIDTSTGPHRGSAYLVWVRVRFADGRSQLFFAVSRNGGRSYHKPLLLQTTTESRLAGEEELAQVAVRPDGTVDVVWNGVRHGRPVILHASSTDGGRRLTRPEVVVRLRAKASRLGIVSSLAASRHGRLGLCWSQARSRHRYDAAVACKVTDRHDEWGPVHRFLPGSPHAQYLPAVAYQGDRLWVAAYVSGPEATRVVVRRLAGGHFADVIGLNRWPVTRSGICAPHPPDCRPGQAFIGDYIAVVATPGRVTTAYVKPAADRHHLNRVLVSTFRTARDQG